MPYQALAVRLRMDLFKGRSKPSTEQAPSSSGETSSNMPGEDVFARENLSPSPQPLRRSPSILKTPNRKNSDGKSPRRRLSYHPSVLLWDAAENADEKEFLRLLNASREQPETRDLDSTGGSEAQRPEQVALEKEVDLNMTNHEGVSLLHLCCFTGSLACVKALLERGADPNLADFEGWTPLHVSAAARHLGVASALLDAGARCSLHNEADGRLGIAAVTQDREFLRMFVRHQKLPERLRRRSGSVLLAVNRREKDSCKAATASTPQINRHYSWPMW